MVNPPLAILGGAPVRSRFPEPRPRLTRAEAEGLAVVLAAADWSRGGDDWPLPHLDRLEQEWARAHDTAHAVAVSSGTTGLMLALKALGLPVGDEVLVPAYGCPAVDVAVIAAGLTPVHVDLDPRTYAVAAAAAASAVTGRTAALVAVHFAGQPAPMEALARVASRHGLALIEDACLAPGARLGGRSVGTWAHATVVSLGVRKPISCGEGGLITTNDASLTARLRAARSLGADPESGDIRQPTGNFRLTDLQAAAALPQLARLHSDIERRAGSAAILAGACANSAAFRPLEPLPECLSTWAQFWIRYDEEAAGVPRERVVEAVQAEGIPLFAGWSRPNYCLAVYTPERAREWLQQRGSGRDPEHYARARCPRAEQAAFNEALLFDFPLLDGDPESIRDAAEALARVSEQLHLLRNP